MNGPSKSRFDQIFSQGQRLNGRLFRVCSLPGTGLLGVTTSKSLGCHARRNRQKRRARAVLNQMWKGVVELDVAVLVRDVADKATPAELEEELGRLLEETRKRWAGGLEPQ